MTTGLLAGLIFIFFLKLLSFSLVESSANLTIKELPAVQQEKQHQDSTNTTIEWRQRGKEKREEEENENCEKRVSLKAKGVYGGGSELRHSRPAKNKTLPSSSSSFALSFSAFLLLFFLFEA